jgi:hypothetical protein
MQCVQMVSRVKIMVHHPRLIFPEAEEEGETEPTTDKVSSSFFSNHAQC